jgi:hypothetical protein
MNSADHANGRVSWAMTSLAGTWVLCAAPVGLYWMLNPFFPDRSELAEGLLLALCGALPVLSIAGAILFGGPSAEQAALYQVYAEFTGYPVDVARLRQQRRPLHERLFPLVVERARGQSGRSYRSAYLPETEWPQIALDPQVTDLPLLRAALTLARLDASLAPARERRARSRLHADLWRKLKSLSPHLVV